MKKMLLLCALVVALVVYLHVSELSKAKLRIAAAEERIRLVERERVPRAELARAQAAVADAQDRTAALEQELKSTREQLAASQEKVRAAEVRPGVQVAKTPETGSSIDLVKGSYSLLDDTLVYSPDAQLKVGSSILISSPTGMMLSDKDVATVAGDLAVETPSGTMQAAHAFIDVNGGKIEMTADSMTFTNK